MDRQTYALGLCQRERRSRWAVLSTGFLLPSAALCTMGSLSATASLGLALLSLGIVVLVWHAARARVVVSGDRIEIRPAGWFSAEYAVQPHDLISVLLLRDRPTARLELMPANAEPFVLGPFDPVTRRYAERRLACLAVQLRGIGVLVGDARHDTSRWN